jgi:hypothetical protein
MEKTNSQRAVEIRRAGKSNEEIAAELGVSLKCANDLPYDEIAFGPDGVHFGSSFHCMRGCDYHVNGVATDGAKNQVRKISTGRKEFRGMASDGYDKQKGGK